MRQSELLPVILEREASEQLEKLKMFPQNSQTAQPYDILIPTR